MTEQQQGESENEKDKDIFQYGDPGISSADAPVPVWLRSSHVFWTIFGFVWLLLYWNGSWGWLDPGYWQQLQRAANTTFPTENFNDLEAGKHGTRTGTSTHE